MRVYRIISVRALTFLEVLIAMTLLAIVAVLLGPDFLDCWDSHEPGRSRVSRVRADMRSMATALEAYYVDSNVYPEHRPLREFYRKPDKLRKAGGGGLSAIEPGNTRRGGLTTPTPYITSLFIDPFAPEAGAPFAYYTDGGGWILLSPGPDGDYDVIPRTTYDSSIAQPSPKLLLLAYDPTNGTVSDGDVWRVKQ